MIDDIKARLLALDELAGWPAMVDLVERLREIRPMSSLDYPLLAAEAVGGKREQALPAAAALYCLQTAIHLVDDMLDREPEGLHQTLGRGRTANLALGLQAAGLRVIDQTEVSAECRAAIQGRFADMALATAYGQDLELEHRGDEESYWRVVRAKTPPLFAAALFAGAILGGATIETGRQVESLGEAIGMIIQIHDDLHDAMESPARPDWQRPGINLPILYASIAEHPERRRFCELAARAHEPEALAEGQEILVRSGAMSYCCYHVIEHYHRARTRLSELTVPRAERLGELLDHQIEPLRQLFAHAGITELDSLFAP